MYISHDCHSFILIFLFVFEKFSDRVVNIYWLQKGIDGIDTVILGIYLGFSKLMTDLFELLESTWSFSFFEFVFFVFNSFPGELIGVYIVTSKWDEKWI